MKNNLLDDARDLSQRLLDYLDMNVSQDVVNIALEVNRKDIRFTGKYSSITKALGYAHDKTPALLKKHGVIEGKTSGWWFVGFAPIKGYWGQKRPEDLAMDDGITHVAQEKGYISRNNVTKYYFHYPTDDIGPPLEGGMAILVNRQRLKKFLFLCGSLKVNFNEVEQSLEFLGESIPFEGKLEAERVKLLIDNINKVVASDDFIKVQYKFPKSNVIDSDIEENTRHMFKRIRNKIKRNEVLKNALTLKESKGFCMKIEEEFVETFLSSSK